MKRTAPLLTALLLTPVPALATPPTVEAIKATPGAGGWSFSVTLSHADTGWEDYADGWRVVGSDGTIYGTRPLAHPHVNEQPFTRAQSGIKIPEGTATVYIETSTSPEGWWDARHEVRLPK
ncbi:hypothetical protein [Vannielia sp.]|uniref:hypothetical protein n=1 Tax=Vannielia sp. TaxID=2813045 RepID=UPI0026218213|nr:hypothetical protein [Vannielia sp.]MDF1871523.1 hypothetical protein [Vannielia sp.]